MPYQPTLWPARRIGRREGGIIQGLEACSAAAARLCLPRSSVQQVMPASQPASQRRNNDLALFPHSHAVDHPFYIYMWKGNHLLVVVVRIFYLSEDCACLLPQKSLRLSIFTVRIQSKKIRVKKGGRGYRNRQKGKGNRLHTVPALSNNFTITHRHEHHRQVVFPLVVNSSEVSKPSRSLLLNLQPPPLPLSWAVRNPSTFLPFLPPIPPWLSLNTSHSFAVPVVSRLLSVSVIRIGKGSESLQCFPFPFFAHTLSTLISLSLNLSENPSTPSPTVKPQ